MIHKSLLFVVFTTFSHLLFSQAKPDKIAQLGDRRTELYYFSATNYDSIRFTIQGEKDTVLAELFFRNGRVREKKWKKDSSYSFSSQGFIENKKFYFNQFVKLDSLIEFYNNGGIKKIKARRDNVFIIDINYNERGEITEKIDQKRIGKSSWYHSVSDSLGKLYTGRFDTIIVDKMELIWEYDTFYHRNGVPIYIGVENNKDNYLSQQFYDNKGNLIESITPFSKRLIPFKDNVDCYYGFKNNKGDTLIPPRFDRYKEVGNNFFAVYEGSKCRLMHFDGTLVSTPAMEDINELKEANLNSTIENDYYWRTKIGSILLYGLFEESMPIVWRHFPKNSAYFSYTIGKNYGVIDHQGNSVMPPQYFPLDEYLNNGQYFHYRLDEVTPNRRKTGLVKRDGTPLFPLFDNTYLSDIDGYVTFYKEIEDTTSTYETFVRGLLDKNGNILLDSKFDEIELKNESDLFMVNIKSKNGNKDNEGVFDAKNKRWVVDTSDFIIDSDFRESNYTTFFSHKNKKKGAFNKEGAIVLPLIYDHLDLIDDKKAFFIAKKEDKYSFLILNSKDNKKRPKYDYLKSVGINVKLEGEATEMPLFLAKRTDKWGIIDSNDRVLYPFTADYMGIEYETINHSRTIIVVEKEKVSIYDAHSFPRKNNLIRLFTKGKQLFNAYLLESYSKNFFFNSNGDVIIPPQYKVLNNIFRIDNDDENVEYYYIENEAKQRKIVFAKTGKIIDFPFSYDIKYAAPTSKIIVVADEKQKKYEQNFGVVTTDGRELVSPTNYGIAFNPYNTMEQNNYFIRKDIPKKDDDFYGRLNTMDTLTDVDNQWFMYNVEGVLLNKKPFRFPFYFNGELGLGMQDDTFNLFRKDGSIFSDTPPNQIPPQYSNMRRDEKTGLYYCFQNQGLTTTVSIRKQDGSTLLKSGRYDGASGFYGKYALVSLRGKVGLIDSFGHEIIAPQDLNGFDNGNLIDSLKYENAKLIKLIESYDNQESPEMYLMRSKLQDFPIKMGYYSGDYPNNPDSLNISPRLRNTVWHLLLGKKLDEIV